MPRPHPGERAVDRRHTGLTSGAVTGLINHLERQGLVERAADPNPDHRRKVLVRVSEDGVAPIAACFVPMEKTMQDLLADNSKEELKLLFDSTVRGAAFVLAREAELDEGK